MESFYPGNKIAEYYKKIILCISQGIFEKTLVLKISEDFQKNAFNKIF